MIHTADTQFLMLQNMYRELSQKIENMTRPSGYAASAEGSVASPLLSTSGMHAANEPSGFYGVMKTLTRNYANSSVVRDPAEIRLVNEKRFDIVKDFIAFVDLTATNADMIKHIKCMDKLKVRNTATPCTT